MTRALLPLTREAAQRAVHLWHSHHRPHRQQRLAIGYEVAGGIVAAVVLEDPKARLLRDGRTWEVTRLCVGPDAPHCAASTLLGAAWRACSGAGVRRLVSYTRQDEEGTCYRAAGWVATALTRGEDREGRRKANRFLPGLHEPSTEVVDRVRWEIGPDAATTRVRRIDGVWVPQNT